MELNEIIKTLSRTSKKADIPGAIEKYLDELCPLCNKKLRKMKPCCSSPIAWIACSCGYKREDK
jgi:hypothetical protein